MTNVEQATLTAIANNVPDLTLHAQSDTQNNSEDLSRMEADIPGKYFIQINFFMRQKNSIDKFLKIIYL